MSTYRTMSLQRARARGLRPEVWTAEELHADVLAAGRDKCLYVSFGTVRGRGECFGTETLRAADGAVDVLDSSGRKVMSYPLGMGRRIRLLVR